MKPNNEYTSPEQRFFYPVNHEIEHHETLDTVNLPVVERIGGKDHYVIMSTSEGEKCGAELYGNSFFNIPGTAKILGASGFPEQSKVRRDFGIWIRENDFDAFDDSCSFSPEPQEGVSVIVQLDQSSIRGPISDSRFARNGTAILPFGDALPTFEEDEIAIENVRYRLLGFISPDDKLITWQGPMSYTALLVDWSVANVLKQNRLEEALLHDALPRGGHLVGVLSRNEAASTYLRYFDNKHGTQFIPSKDPRHPVEDNFPHFTEEEYATYRKLAELAHSFMTNPR